LGNGGAQLAHGAQRGGVAPAGVHAVEADAEAHHVEVGIGKAQDARRVERVLEHGVAQRRFEAGSHAAEGRELALGEGVVRGLVGGGQVGHQAGHGQVGRVLAQPGYQRRQVGFVEAEAAHSGVQLEVNWGNGKRGAGRGKSPGLLRKGLAKSGQVLVQ